MLEAIRTATKTWIAKLILAVITVPFALWGVESYIRNAPGTDSIATVGDQKVTSLEFNNAVRNQLDQFRQQFGNIDPTVMDSPEMRKSILDQLIDQKLVARAGSTLGISVADATIGERLGGEPSFQENGKFSEARLAAFIKAQGYTSESFVKLLRADMERQRFVDSIAGTTFIADASAQQYLRASEQTRDVAVVTIAPEAFAAEVKIGPEQAKAYYEAKKADFTIPEQVRAEYVELSVDALAPQMPVGVDDIKTYFDINNARFVQKEERKASHILIGVTPKASDADKKAAKEKADGIYAKVKANPKSFAELAKANSQDPGSAAKGGDLGFFGRGAMVKPFEEAAFRAKKDEVVGPVLSDFGYHIIRVDEIRPEKGKTLAEATPEIEGELKKQKAAKSFAELAERFSTVAFEQSTSLKAAADVVKLPIKQSGWISKGMGAAPPFTQPKLVAALFSEEVLKNKRNSEAIEVAPSDLVVARVLESKPSMVRPYAEVEAGIIARLTREEAGKLARKDGEAKLKQLQAGKTDAVKFPALLAVSRASTGGLAPNLVDAAMKAAAKTLPTYVGAESPAGGYVLIQVAKVNEPAVTDEAKLQSARTHILQSQSQQQLQSSLLALRSRTDVSIAKDALEKKAQ